MITLTEVVQRRAESLVNFKNFSFTVPGRPVGYIALGPKPNWKAYKKYIAYSDLVREEAGRAGLATPLMATRECPVIVNTVAYFRNGTHPDPGNVQKGVCDALFYIPRKTKKKGAGDKYTGGAFVPPLYDKENPRVEVTVAVSLQEEA